MIDIEYTWEEIALFVIMLGSCFAVTIYFACKRTTLNEYVMGGGSLGVGTVSMSLIASSLSSISFGYANDVYQFGPHITCDLIGVVMMGVVCWTLIPVLQPLNLISLSDYGLLRFNSSVQKCMSINILIFMNFLVTIVTYSTALFVSQISGLGPMNCFLIIMISCYVLTSIGGFRGVVWTDTLQAIAMFASVFVLAVIGLIQVGGVTEVYRAALEKDRLSFDWSYDPTKRLTVWSATISFFVQRISTNSILIPTIYQRYAALRTQAEARKTAVIHALGVFFIVFCTLLLGYIMFALFENCDPVLSGQVTTYDQILPYFVEYIGQRAQFARGVYIVGYISASVSTLSTVMNTYAVTLYKDFIYERFNKDDRKGRGRKIIHLTGLLMVVVSILLVQFLQKLGSVTDLTALLNPTSTIYACIVVIGIFFPWIGSKGILWATFITLVSVAWISIGTQLEHSRGLVRYPIKPMDVSDCVNLNASRIADVIIPDSDIFYVYKMTPFLQTSMCVILMFFISAFVTLITGSNDLSTLDRRLLSPWVRQFLPEATERTTEDVPLNALVRHDFEK